MLTLSIGLVGTASLILLAGTFLFAALSKVWRLRSLRETIERLGLGHHLALPVSVMVLAAEFCVAAGLLLWPQQAWPRALVLFLAVSFAGAGVKALASGQRIRCSCFGDIREETLGWTQVRRLGIWLALVGFAWWHSPSWSWRNGLMLLATLMLCMVLIRLPTLLRRWRTLHGDRLAIAEGLRPRPVNSAPGKVGTW